MVKIIEVGSDSTGGTGYLTRMLRTLVTVNKHTTVLVVIKEGEHQEKVFTDCLDALSLFIEAMYKTNGVAASPNIEIKREVV